jgi:DNA-binding transcriptional regulator YhcF (GntR family)
MSLSDKAREFIKLFIPKQKKFHKDKKSRELFNVQGFSMVFGHNYQNNPEFAMLDFAETPRDLSDLDKIYIAEETDNYFTPNIFLGNNYDRSGSSRKHAHKCTWIQDLFIDIDGTNGIKDPAQAKEVLYQALQDLGIPKPTALIHTSTNPDVHLQVHWLIDPLWVYDNRKETVNNGELLSWHYNVMSALVELLQEQLPDWELDTTKSTDISTYARLPYSYNQKTGQLVEVLDVQDRRWTLEDSWVANILKRSYKNNNQKEYIKINTDIKLLEHPQIQVLLQGVSEGYRNYAQYAIALACRHDGLSQEEAIKVLLEQNKKCSPKERKSKVIGVLKSAYRGDKGLSSKIVAQLVSDITGQEVKPDYSLFAACKEGIKVKPKAKKGIYTPKQVMIQRVIKEALELIRKGVEVLPSSKEMAQLVGVSASSLKKIWSEIIKILQNVGLQLDNSAHYHHKYIILDRAKQLLKRAKPSTINLEILESIVKALRSQYSIIELLELKTKKEIENFANLVANSPP